MSEAQDDVFPTYPCQTCGASGSQPCADDCADALAFAASERDWYATAPLTDSLSRLAAAVHRLPFGGNVGLPGLGAPDRQNYSEQEYIERLASWMEDYEPVLTAKVDELQEQSRQRIGLQLERDVFDTAIRRALEGAGT